MKMVDVTQWEPVDMEFMKEFLGLHNAIVMKRKSEEEFDQFVLEHKVKLNNPDYLQVFAERVQIEAEYFKNHKEVCQFFYDFMKSNPDWEGLPFGFRTYMRLGIFFDTFEEFLIGKPLSAKEA